MIVNQENQMNQGNQCDIYPNPFECDSSHLNHYKMDIETEINNTDEIFIDNNIINIELYTKVVSVVCCLGVYLFINFMI